MTRHDVATYLADRLAGPDRASAVRHAAAWLVEGKRTSELPYLAQDVAALTATDRGYVAATMTTATPASAETRHQAESFLRRHGATTVELTSMVDPHLIGGVVIATPTTAIDLSLRKALLTLSQGDPQ